MARSRIPNESPRVDPLGGWARLRSGAPLDERALHILCVPESPSTALSHHHLPRWRSPDRLSPIGLARAGSRATPASAATLPMSHHTRDLARPLFYALHGSTSVTPHPSKSCPFRVARLRPWTRPVAAISMSACATPWRYPLPAGIGPAGRRRSTGWHRHMRAENIVKTEVSALQTRASRIREGYMSLSPARSCFRHREDWLCT